MPGLRAAQWIGALGLAALWLAMLLLGGGGLDGVLLLDLYVADTPGLALAAMLFTYLGNGKPLIAITAAVAGWLIYRGRTGAAALLVVATLSGRVLVVLQKLYFARLRPEENLRLVEVSSLSFPSAHAANSTMVFLGIALLAFEDPRRRKWALGAALLLSFLIGLSRPMLGVHWPSDVIAGWSFGALWLLLWLRLAGPAAQAKRLTHAERFSGGST